MLLTAGTIMATKVDLPAQAPKNECGQATLEFIHAFWLLFAFFLIMLAIATVWYGHIITSPVSLEAASRESVQPGWGQEFIHSSGNSLSKNTQLDTSISNWDSGLFQSEANILTVSGKSRASWMPFSINWSVPVQGSTIFPVWEFHGGSP
jgi:hypothetical protein